jgi:hypothetical protein
MFYAHAHVLCVYEIVLRKTDFLCGLDKNEKNRYQNKPFRDAFFLSSLYRPRTMSNLNKTLRDHIECGDLNANIFS